MKELQRRSRQDLINPWACRRRVQLTTVSRLLKIQGPGLLLNFRVYIEI
jgi:hypothetical protein